MEASSRARFLRLVVVITALAAGGLACSFLIDVEPDCDQVSDCRPYVCNPENTACLSACITNADCAPGFLCQRGGTTCVNQGCEPLTNTRALFSLDGAGLEFDAARLGDRLWIIAASTAGVGLVEVTLEGGVVGGSEGITSLDDEPTSPVTPLAVSSSRGVTVFWRGESDEGTGEFRVFHVDTDGQSQGPNAVYVAEPGENLDAPSAGVVGDAIVLAWSTFIDRSQVVALPLNLDGTYGPNALDTAPAEAVTQLTSPATGSNLPAVAATPVRGAVARRESISARSEVVVSFLDSDFEAINDHRLSVQGVASLDNVRAAGMSSGVATAWIESTDEGRRLMRAVDTEAGPILFGSPSDDFTFEPTEVDIASGSSEFLLLWVANSDQGEDVYVRRFDELGAPLFETFSASTGAANSPARPVAVRTQDGYALLWVENDVSPPQLMYRRFRCVR